MARIKSKRYFGENAAFLLKNFIPYDIIDKNDKAAYALPRNIFDLEKYKWQKLKPLCFPV